MKTVTVTENTLEEVTEKLPKLDTKFNKEQLKILGLLAKVYVSRDENIRLLKVVPKRLASIVEDEIKLLNNEIRKLETEKDRLFKYN